MSESDTIADRVFIAGGEMGARMRALDWSQTPLGDITTWRQSLRSAISILLPSKAQICLFWGSELITLYNDAYRPALASKHPWALGRPARETWSEVWDVIQPLLEGVVTTGEAFWARDHLFFLNRYGYSEETYFDVSYDPVRDESGEVGGVFCIVSETTGRVLGDRRLQTLGRLASETAQAQTIAAAYQTAMQALATNAHDIPFALLYRVEAEGKATLVETTGFPATPPATLQIVDLSATDEGWKFGLIEQTRQAIVVENLAAQFDTLSSGAWDKSPTTAWVVPLIQSGQSQIAEFLVLGINPHRAFEPEYRGFFELVANHVATGIARARAFEEERQRIQALAELDRAKTSFFSNISHEFRTPLTLMLSPLEQTLSEFNDSLPAEARSQLELVQRNGTRLLKLVNTLLDFSRIEAGRTQAQYEPTDLATYTVELASLFQSAVEQAGLQLQVSCPPLPEPVYVDQEMWEKIVLNLLSNAFKFTFEGAIAVALHPVGNQVELTVRDTGTGIPAAELPKLFERFHRVEGARGRTFEGSGIGLSLVRELVQLQGGTIAVESTVGQGSTFRVRLPMGTAHLIRQPTAINATSALASGARPYVQEALGWLPEKQSENDAAISPSINSKAQFSALARILIVDDNPEMRSYLSRILSQFYQVETVAEGKAALAAVRDRTPDLILSDVMMPGMSGFELLGQLRSNAQTRDLPILLLSARAGEESAVEGLEAGADDYLVKPFSARELLARVAANLELGRSRQATARRRLDAVVSSVSDFIYTFDLAGRFSYINKPLLDLWQKSYTEAIGKNFFELDYPTELAARLQQQIQQVIATRQPLKDETPYTSAFGTRTYEYIFVPLFDSEGVVEAVAGTTRDITDRKQAEAALRESEELKQRIFESSKDCIKVLTLSSEIVYISPGGLYLLEIDDSSAILNTIWVERWQGEDYEKAKAAIAAATSGETGQFQGYLPSAKGTPKWWDTIITPVRDASGQVVQLLAISRDITEAKQSEAERQQAELALREAHVQLEAALAAGAVYTWRWHIPVDRVIVNAAFAHLFGVNPASATTEGLPIEFFINSMHEEDRPRVSAAIEQAIKTGKEYTSEYRVRTGTGEERWVTARGRVEYDAAGRPIALPGALADITARKQAEEALRRSEEHYRTLFESIDDGFCSIEMIFDENNAPIDYRFLEINPAFEQQSGLVKAVGKRMLELAPTHEKYWFEIYGNVALTGEPIRVEHHAAALNRWFEVYAYRVGLPENCKVAVLFKNISDRKRIEAEREQLLQREKAARETAETANRIKDEFLAVLSHELRSPLNPILGWSRLLKMGRLDATKTAEALNTIERNAKLQSQLIEDLLDVSRILQGKLRLNVAPVTLMPTIEAAIETVRLAAEAKQIQIQPILDLADGQVSGDAGRLQQVVWNLLSNAVKFTPKGGRVEIRLTQVDDAAQLQVIDTGKGIRPDFLPYVFEHFRQEDGATTRKFGGLGLGLAIVRQLVELHGGTVFVESAGENQGATFTVKLPLLKRLIKLADDFDDASFTDDAALVNGLKVLVVDDEPDSRDFVAFVLEQAGADVVALSSATEVLQSISHIQPDLLISDIGMPEMDGYMLIEYIRTQLPAPNCQVCAIALTAYAGEANERQVLNAGFQKHLAKPIDPLELIATVSRLTAFFN
jgi:PAS domain S-box-containing protein